MVKRFLVFAYGDNTARGGWNDLLGAANDEQEAIGIAESDQRSSFNGIIVDLELGQVKQWRRDSMLRIRWPPSYTPMDPALLG